MAGPAGRIASSLPLCRGWHDGVATARGRDQAQFDSGRFEGGGTVACRSAWEHHAKEAPVHEFRTSVGTRMGRRRRRVPGSDPGRKFRNVPVAWVLRSEPSCWDALAAHAWTIGTPPRVERYALIIESGLEARDRDQRDSDMHC